jgi:hypothetical protein
MMDRQHNRIRRWQYSELSTGCRKHRSDVYLLPLAADKINRGALQKTDKDGDEKVTPEKAEAHEPVISTNKTDILR